ncbi:hypothetical protein A0H81_05892 [Grifola frondosa]|uniref:Uncharacterized protein n=1 Tax=Grifola frondosa TaxID=5627 RepID=A0A1C7MA66_GRIFR|nr:hypothetical protein A0H81_05892 [Grifola frondosa]
MHRESHMLTKRNFQTSASPDVVAASLDDVGIQEVAGLEALIPDNFAFSADECLQCCDIQRSVQSTNQRRSHLPSNALPSGFSGSPAPGATSTSASSTPSSGYSTATACPTSTSTPTHYNRNIWQTQAQLLGALSDASSSVSSSMQPVTIALIVVAGVMALGYLVMAILFLGRRRGADKMKIHVHVCPALTSRYLVPTVEEKYDSSS